MNGVNVVSSSSCIADRAGKRATHLVNGVSKLSSNSKVTNSLNGTQCSSTTTSDEAQFNLLFADKTNSDQIAKWKKFGEGSAKNAPLLISSEYSVSTTTKPIDIAVGQSAIDQPNQWANPNLESTSYKSKVSKRNKTSSRKPYRTSSPADLKLSQKGANGYKDPDCKESSNSKAPLNLPLNINCSDNIGQTDWSSESYAESQQTNKVNSKNGFIWSSQSNYSQLDCIDQNDLPPQTNFSLNPIQFQATASPPSYGCSNGYSWMNSGLDSSNPLYTEASLNQFLKNSEHQTADNLSGYSSYTSQISYYAHSASYTNNGYTYHQPVCSDYYWTG